NSFNLNYANQLFSLLSFDENEFSTSVDELKLLINQANIDLSKFTDEFNTLERQIKIQIKRLDTRKTEIQLNRLESKIQQLLKDEINIANASGDLSSYIFDTLSVQSGAQVITLSQEELKDINNRKLGTVTLENDQNAQFALKYLGSLYYEGQGS